ncbi:transmembrane protein, putative (macronuclear) [Tetrahymena thermophila SB210]|uniref:Transmembrane protein, putative n=1 Tax=Tetrahymena thermophila (strain SB210) TaxID=312017 RepID=I7LVM4_TETTS|nr:transmembrane protein, putative [Tetrahymena thermophila SB210]EAR99349.2 transmembrane protein, putative [Tetrahymena thermophila SB210]|eukprot:XP_001019594.2 transmembrane protein, putative [Tetrahymena thermophila SB210]
MTDHAKKQHSNEYEVKEKEYKDQIATQQSQLKQQDITQFMVQKKVQSYPKLNKNQLLLLLSNYQLKKCFLYRYQSQCYFRSSQIYQSLNMKFLESHTAQKTFELVQKQLEKFDISTKQSQIQVFLVTNSAFIIALLALIF